MITGTCVCPGEARGLIRIFDKEKKYSKKDIVILPEFLTQNVLLLKNAGAILAKKGGLTAHASIIARELDIPCLINIEGLEQIKEGTKIKIDAAAEEVEVL